MKKLYVIKSNLLNRRKVLLFHVLDYQNIGHTGATEEEDLENIQDAIVDYLSVVDELTQESEIRYVEVARDAKTFGSISQKSD